MNKQRLKRGHNWFVIANSSDEGKKERGMFDFLKTNFINEEYSKVVNE